MAELFLFGDGEIGRRKAKTGGAHRRPHVHVKCVESVRRRLVFNLVATHKGVKEIDRDELHIALPGESSAVARCEADGPSVAIGLVARLDSSRLVSSVQDDRMAASVGSGL
jgi:hypothetical protein